MENQNKPNKFYDLKLKEEVFLVKEANGSITLIYDDSGIRKNVSKEYVDKNIADINPLAEALFDDIEIK